MRENYSYTFKRNGHIVEMCNASRSVTWSRIISLSSYCLCQLYIFCTQRSFTFPLLYLLGCSANVALVYFGGKSKRVESFSNALLLGTDIDKHQGLGIASEAVLQQVGQLRVPVGNMRRLKRKI